MRKSSILASIAALTAFVAAGPAYAASATIELRATVPVVCNLAYRSGGSFGQLHAFCNSARGYVIEVQYTPGALENALLTAGDAQLRLDGSGRQTLVDSNWPVNGARPLGFEMAGEPASEISFRIVPKPA